MAGMLHRRARLRPAPAGRPGARPAVRRRHLRRPARAVRRRGAHGLRGPGRRPGPRAGPPRRRRRPTAGGREVGGHRSLHGHRGADLDLVVRGEPARCSTARDRATPRRAASSMAFATASSCRGFARMLHGHDHRGDARLRGRPRPARPGLERLPRPASSPDWSSAGSPAASSTWPLTIRAELESVAHTAGMTGAYATWALADLAEAQRRARAGRCAVRRGRAPGVAAGWTTRRSCRGGPGRHSR